MKTAVGALFSAVVFSSSVQAHDLIIKLKPGVRSAEATRVLPADGKGRLEPLVRENQLYRLDVKTKSTLADTLQDIEQNPQVEYVQVNHQMQPRRSPDDVGFGSQWSLGQSALTQIRAQQAWDITTGGKNARGESLVVAIVDGGFDIEHPDLVSNLWSNAGEVPDNGIDDDHNGYVDDVHGWNAAQENSKIAVENHGTHVAGIIGAKGNNQIGVCGVNWDTQILYVSIENYSTAEIAVAYDYIIKQKKLWISSNGQQGANIVVTNSSFGHDRADCQGKDFPIWNDLYNQMGEVGILSAVAGPNHNWDVDVVGDVPSGCNSDYLISVTNIDSTGNISGAGRGKVSIDLGAPGRDILSTVHEEHDFNTGSEVTYTEYSGTSMATPHVAGSVALMLSAASENLLNEYDRDPALAALLVKELLLSSVTLDSHLKGVTTSGGRLNLEAAVKAAQSY